MGSNDLSERIHNAIVKMGDAKKAYNRIIELYSDRDRSNDYYIQNFYAIQSNIYSAIDILLGCFVEEKQIQLWKVSKVNGSREIEPLDGNFKSTKDYCHAILYHNYINPENQYLTDVDFECITVDKNVRNQDEHLGIQKDLQDVYRIFLNLNKILLQLGANEKKITVRLEDEPELFDFAIFDSYVNQAVEEKRFILLTESLHNIDKEQLSSFLRLPWALIIDFDGSTELGGLKSSLIQNKLKFNSYNYSYVTDESNDIEFYNRTIHIQMCDNEDLRIRYTANSKSNSKDYRLMDKLLMKLRDTSHPYATIMIIGNVTQRMNQLCTYISGEFKETDVVILSKQSNKNLFVPTCTEEDEIEDDEGVIENVYQFNCSVFSSMRSIHDNIKLLPITNTVLYSDNTGYRMPNEIILDVDYVDKLEDEIEFIHCGLGRNVETFENQFYHGDIITWEAINNECAFPLVGDRFSSYISNILNTSAHHCFYIYHLPGFGGTTLGRQLVWAIHEKIPTVRLKKYVGRNDFKRTLNDLYRRFNNGLFWILVDENVISDGDIEDIEKEITTGDYNVCALIVRRITESEARRKNRKPQSNEIVLSIVETHAKEAIESKCLNLLGNFTLFKKRKEIMDATLEERHKCPLLINLYLLEEDFKLDTYVKGCINKIPNDYDREKMLNLLAFIAIGSYYSNIKIPSSYCKQYMNFKTTDVNLTCYEGILLKRQEEGMTKYCINHYLIAEEILTQLLGGDEREHWRGNLCSCLKKYIDWLILLLNGVNAIDDNVISIVSSLFTDKTKSSQWESKDFESSFTRLLSDMDEYQRLDIMTYLSNRMSSIITKNIPSGKQRKEYRMLAHIYAQQARVRLESNRLDENMDDESAKRKNDELEEYIRRTQRIIDDEDICEYALEDILARCSLKRAEAYKNSLSGSLEKQNVELIIHYVDDAIKHFSYTIWYGSPDYGVPGKMKALYLGLETLNEYYSWSEAKRLEGINSDTVAKVYLEETLSSFQDIEEYALSKISYTIATTMKSNLEKLIYPEEPSELLQRLDSIRRGLDPSDYESHYFVSTQIVFAYERKHYVEMYRRASLIRKAFGGENAAREDAKRVFENLDRVVKMNVNHSVSYTTYNKWFEYAKYMDVSLARAKDVSREWRDSESKKQSLRNAQYSTLIKPYYYLFVISLLQYKAGIDGVTADEVRKRKADLKSETRKTNHSRVVQDWFCQGKGMGQLFSHEWIDVKDVADESKIAVVKGVVADLDDMSYVGYIEISNPKSLGNWSKPNLGYSYSKDSFVRFVEEQSKMISKRDVGNGKEWLFKFGFSYENFEASMNSLEKLNKNSITVESKQPIEQDQLNKESTIKYSEPSEKDIAKIKKSGILIFTILQKKFNGYKGYICYEGKKYKASIKTAVVKKYGDRYLPINVRIKDWNSNPNGKAFIVEQVNNECKSFKDEAMESLKVDIKSIAENEIVDFYPKEFKTKVVRGTVNGVMASINKRKLTTIQKDDIMHAMKTCSCIKAKMDCINPQRNGYILKTDYIERVLENTK